MQRICGVNPDSGLANSNLGLIGGTKPWQSLTRRAKFDEMCDVALDLCSFPE